MKKMEEDMCTHAARVPCCEVVSCHSLKNFHRVIDQAINDGRRVWVQTNSIGHFFDQGLLRSDRMVHLDDNLDTALGTIESAFANQNVASVPITKNDRFFISLEKVANWNALADRLYQLLDKIKGIGALLVFANTSCDEGYEAEMSQILAKIR